MLDRVTIVSNPQDYQDVFALPRKAKNRYFPPPMSLNGKVSIVTGASSGIGRATAFALANQGVKQVITARSADKLERLAKELPGESLVVQADMTDPKHMAPTGATRGPSTLGAWISSLPTPGFTSPETLLPAIPMPGID